MTSTFTLALDTGAPVVTFEGVGGTTAGELLTVLYSIDEPAITSASIHLADGRDLALEILSDRLRVLLPADTPEGNATVTVHTADDVGNAGTQTQIVALHGTIVVPPDEPPVGGGGPPQRPIPIRDPFARRRGHSIVQTTTRSRIRARLHDDALVTVTSEASILRQPSHFTSEATAITRSRTRVRRRDTSRVRVDETTAISKRFVGRGEEDELIFLGLL